MGSVERNAEPVELQGKGPGVGTAYPVTIATDLVNGNRGP